MLNSVPGALFAPQSALDSKFNMLNYAPGALLYFSALRRNKHIRKKSKVVIRGNMHSRKKSTVETRGNNHSRKTSKVEIRGNKHTPQSSTSLICCTSITFRKGDSKKQPFWTRAWEHILILSGSQGSPKKGWISTGPFRTTFE